MLSWLGTNPSQAHLIPEGCQCFQNKEFNSYRKGNRVKCSSPTSSEVKLIDTAFCSGVKSVNLQLRLQSGGMIIARTVPAKIKAECLAEPRLQRGGWSSLDQIKQTGRVTCPRNWGKDGESCNKRDGEILACGYRQNSQDEGEEFTQGVPTKKWEVL